MIPLKINDTHLCEIFNPGMSVQSWTDERIDAYSLENHMYPSEVHVTSEAYSRDAERTADYELEKFIIVNRKAKVEVTWELIEAAYVEKLMSFLGYHYNFKDAQGEIVPVEADSYNIQYRDFMGQRSLVAYLGQTLEGTQVMYDGKLYWENFRLAFPER